MSEDALMGGRNGVSSNLANYNHQSLVEEMDRLNRELEQMKETVLQTSVRAHLLEADLASLFNPEVSKALQKVQEDCNKCSAAVKLE